MTHLLALQLPDRFPEIPSGVLPGLDPKVFQDQGADLHLALVDGELQARCSLWYTSAPPWPGERLGLIGHFGARTEASARDLLAEACRVLAREGCSLAAGPMDGCTWRPYRFVTERGALPPFLLEPDTPAEYPLWWEAAGFRPFQTYRSTLSLELLARDPRLDRVRERLRTEGVRIRPLDPTRFEDELRNVYRVSEQSFRNNVLYTPLEPSAFLEMYRPAAALMKPRLSWIAEDDQGAAGFIFVLPDALQARRGETVDTVIVKTLAVLPGRRYAGLGKVLLELSQGEAARQGYTRAIHALMHESNVSTILSGGTELIRRYTLFSRGLA